VLKKKEEEEEEKKRRRRRRRRKEKEGEAGLTLATIFSSDLSKYIIKYFAV
jgi:hypothetical protein